MEEIIKQLIANHAGKIDLFLIAKLLLETIIFIILLRLANKGMHLFFEKLINKKVEKSYIYSFKLGKEIEVDCE